jgi:hypothetical protein
MAGTMHSCDLSNSYHRSWVIEPCSFALFANFRRFIPDLAFRLIRNKTCNLLPIRGHSVFFIARWTIVREVSHPMPDSGETMMIDREDG